ncbi:MAG: tetratricopeptide repeat protein [Pseudomonadota bacterium]
MFRKHLIALSFAAFAQAALADEDAFDKAIHTYGCADYPKAYAMIVPLAESGHPLAQYQRGLMLEQGQGTVANLAEAYIWYKKAAEQGIADAYFALGQIYHRGVVVAKDEVQAYAAFDVASRLGHAVSGDWRGLVSNALNELDLAKAQKLAGELLAKRPADALDRLR